MKKEKKIRTYQRRTKSGKMVTVKAHTAKYDAAEHARELAKKKGAGDELEERKKKKTPQLELPFDENSDKDALNEVKEVEKKETKKSTKADTPKKEAKPKTTTKTKATDSKTSEPAFTAAEFKEWYQGTGSAADKKVAKALRAQLGRAGYKKLEDEAIDSYSARGHLSMFKRVSAPTTDKASKPTKATSTEPKPKAKSKGGKGVNVGEGKPKSKKTEPDPWEEHVKSQVSALKHLERTTARLEESLRTAKSTHSKLWTNDPKRMRYAKRIQNLQQKLADTKEALEHQRQRVEDVTKPSKTSVKKPYTAPTHKPSKKVIESMTTGKDWIYGD